MKRHELKLHNCEDSLPGEISCLTEQQSKEGTIFTPPYHFQLLTTQTFRFFYLNFLSANLTKLLNTLKKFVSFCQRIVWLCLWGWGLKG